MKLTVRSNESSKGRYVHRCQPWLIRKLEILNEMACRKGIDLHFSDGRGQAWGTFYCLLSLSELVLNTHSMPASHLPWKIQWNNACSAGYYQKTYSLDWVHKGWRHIAQVRLKKTKKLMSLPTELSPRKMPRSREEKHHRQHLKLETLTTTEPKQPRCMAANTNRGQMVYGL